MSASMMQMLAASGGADTTAPTITSANTDSVAENATLSHALTANESVTWSIVGGADQTKLEISGSTLRWASNGTKDYEAPDDADTNNTYIVQVRATDLASNTTDQTITVTVTNVAATLNGTLTNATLSNANLTASHSNTSQGGARVGSPLQNSGKFYFEVTLTTITGTSSGVGLLTSAGTFANFLAGTSNCSALYQSGGAIWSNNANTSRTLGNLANGDVIGIAADFDNDKVWYRKAPSGNWNGQVIGSQDPASNVGGVSISNYTATTLGPVLAFSGNATEAFTANFGTAAFSGTVPAGFTSGWPE